MQTMNVPKEGFPFGKDGMSRVWFDTTTDNDAKTPLHKVANEATYWDREEAPWWAVWHIPHPHSFDFHGRAQGSLTACGRARGAHAGHHFLTYMSVPVTGDDAKMHRLIYPKEVEGCSGTSCWDR
jgi:hypothetical protein